MHNSDVNEATLVLASFNHASYIPDALASVAAQVGVRLQLIVTDDASTDDSVAVIERELSNLGLTASTIFHRHNRGICATFNEALAQVETPFVAFLAADDWMEPTRFARHVEALRLNPDAALVYGDMWIGDPEAAPRSERYSSWWGDGWKGGRHDRLFRDLVEFNWIPAPTVLMRTDAIRAVGGYDEALAYEDHDMWLRLARSALFAFVDEPLVTWRRVPGSLSSQLDKRSDDERRLSELRMFAKHIGRRDEVDRWLEPRIFHLAVSAYKSGNHSPEIAGYLRRCLRAKPRPQTIRFAASATAQSMRRSR